MGSYGDLIERLPLRPIKSEQQLDEAILVATDLYGNIEGLNDDEQDYLDVLSTLIHRYEQQHHTRPGNFTPIQHLRSLFEANHMKSGELAKLLSVTPGRASEIWNENRDLSKAHILLLAERFCVSADLFLGKASKRVEGTKAAAKKTTRKS